jgi:hypothetical protein
MVRKEFSKVSTVNRLVANYDFITTDEILSDIEQLRKFEAYQMCFLIVSQTTVEGVLCEKLCPKQSRQRIRAPLGTSSALHRIKI